MKRRAQIGGLNPDRADSVIGGAARVAGDHAALGVDRIVVSSRGVREGLALGGPRRVRSAARLGAHDLGRHALRPVRHVGRDGAPSDGRPRDAACTTRSTPRRATPSARCWSTRPPSSTSGRAIDYYDRFEHAAMIVTSADLGGFTHETLGILSAILRQADDDIRLGPYRRLIDGRGPIRGLARRDGAGARRRVEASDPTELRRRDLLHLASDGVRRRRSVPPDGDRAASPIASGRCSGDRSTCYSQPLRLG